jgi:hypothetical protein
MSSSKGKVEKVLVNMATLSPRDNAMFDGPKMEKSESKKVVFN